MRLSWDGGFIILFLEGLDVLDVGDVVLHAGEGRESLCWDVVAEILFNLHGDLDGVERVQTVLYESAVPSYTWIGRPVPFL